jgi:hypothetical protein
MFVMNKTDRVKSIDSPYDNIGNQFKRDKELAEFFSENQDLADYDLFQMIPKVTYDDWIVCLYKKDDKLYRINEEDIIEMEVVEVLEYDNNFEVIKENGEPMDEDELFDYCDCLCCGEADDMSCYIYFE